MICHLCKEEARRGFAAPGLFLTLSYLVAHLSDSCKRRVPMVEYQAEQLGF